MAYQSHPLEVLGDPTRRAVFEALRSGPRSVVEIAAGLPVSRPAVSQHLKALKGAGLVRDRRDGNRRLYSIEMGRLADLRAYFDALWDEALDRFKQVSESEEGENDA